MGFKKCPYCFEEIQEEAILCKHCKSNLVKVVDKPKNEANKDKKDSRTKEFAMGLLGGIFGIFSGFISLFIGGIGSAFGASEADLLGNLGVTAIIFSIIGTVGAAIIRKNGKLGGLFMIMAAVGGLISVSAFYILPGILLIIPGIMGLKRKEEGTKKFKWIIWVPACFVMMVMIFVISVTMKPTGSNATSGGKVKITEGMKMGEEVSIGNLGYIANKAIVVNKLEDEFSELTSEGQFLIVEVQVKNNDKESRTIDTRLFQLVEEDGTIYSPDSMADSYVNKDDGFFLATLNPKLSKSGYIVFDVPDITRKYKLGVSGGMLSSDYKYINIEISSKDDKSSDISKTSTANTNNNTNVTYPENNMEPGHPKEEITNSQSESDKVLGGIYNDIIYVEDAVYNDDRLYIFWRDEFYNVNCGAITFDVDTTIIGEMFEIEAVNDGYNSDGFPLYTIKTLTPYCGNAKSDDFE